jgi:CheY-like chemotaxis protein
VPVEAAPAHADALAPAHETILVVEDDPLVSGYVIAQLGSMGYRTISVADGPAPSRWSTKAWLSISCLPT